MTIQAIRGFHDILPEESPLWRRVESAALRVMDAFGYKEIRIPVVEKTELFARSIGESTDIVEKEMFSFPSRKGESLTLRPEATAGVVRSIIEHKMGGDGRPIKLFFIGPMFRYERPQKGRQRQFHQLDVEVFNDPSPHIDAELIILLNHFLNELNLDNVVMNINSLGCPVDRPAYREKLKAFLEPFRHDLCPDCQRRMDTNPLRVLDCKNPQCSQMVDQAPTPLDTLCPDCLDHFEQVKKDLEAVKTPYIVNPRLVRGLDYYSRTTFEALTGELGAQNAVAGGGRYDALAETIGGPNIPGTGFAAGLERLVMLLAEKDQNIGNGPDLFMADLDEAAAGPAMVLANQLRRRGFRVEMDYSPASLKSRMKRAGKLGAARVLIIGPDEMAKGIGLLRDMASKEQVEVALENADQTLAGLLGNKMV